MVYTKYDLRFSLDWENGGTLTGDMDFNEDNLKNVFSQLYTEVVEGSLIDHAPGDIPEKPEIINEIRIRIAKKRVKATPVNYSNSTAKG